MSQEPHRLVFIDETAVSKQTPRGFGGGRLSENGSTAPHSSANGTQTFIADLTQDALIAPWVIDGDMNRPAFYIYVETQLVGVLDSRTVVILNNLSTPKSPRAAQALRRRGF